MIPESSYEKYLNHYTQEHQKLNTLRSQFNYNLTVIDKIIQSPDRNEDYLHQLQTETSKLEAEINMVTSIVHEIGKLMWGSELPEHKKREKTFCAIKNCDRCKEISRKASLKKEEAQKALPRKEEEKKKSSPLRKEAQAFFPPSLLNNNLILNPEEKETFFSPPQESPLQEYIPSQEEVVQNQTYQEVPSNQTYVPQETPQYQEPSFIQNTPRRRPRYIPTVQYKPGQIIVNYILCK